MRASEIRRIFLDFFQKKDHLILPSYSLIPKNDPSLLLIGAGMAPLKPYFTGEEPPPHPRVATSQKCLRTPDIAQVGLTARHATFFEMLGNFSFGDYFKKEAILWSWELVTKGFSLAPERLWVSIYKEDEESFAIWEKEVGVPPEKIIRLGKKDNFWEIGEGPCGPCSEIYYDMGPERGCGRLDCTVGCDCDRYLEVWNLVFTQFDRQANGEYLPLAQKNIDTGMGLERIAAVLQGVPTIFDIDIIRPILDSFCQWSGREYGQDKDADISLRIITEHIRGITFLISDGVLPSNEGRGYVLRRLLRRAVKHGHFLGFTGPFLFQAVPQVVDLMKDFYPELKDRRPFILEVVQQEEKKFLETVELGISILEEMIADLRKKSLKRLKGSDAFKLYDTYGFPLELTEEILAEKGMFLDKEGFQEELEKQRKRARAAFLAASSKEKDADIPDFSGFDPSSFVGYDHLTYTTRLQAIYQGSVFVDSVSAGQKAYILLEKTPFYAESGGQVGDTGYLTGQQGKARVTDTFTSSEGHIIHTCTVESGSLSSGEEINALVDKEKRSDTRRNHTATHLLHRALRNLGGEHIQQAGSLVAPGRLRFDFTNFSPLGSNILEEVEKEVNSLIWENRRIKVAEKSLEEAKKEGVTALFDETYGDRVRVIEVEGYSKELCGGTHVEFTGEIGLFKIISESSIGSGLRRIEASTGKNAYSYLSQKDVLLQQVLQVLNVSAEQLPDYLDKMIKEYKALQKENDDLKLKLASYNMQDLIEKAERVNGVLVVKGYVEADDMASLRKQVDILKNKVKSGIVVLGSIAGEKVMFSGAVTKDLVAEGYHAGKLLHEVASVTGGGGGGRPEMAQAGGKNPALLNDALRQVSVIIKKQLSKTSG